MIEVRHVARSFGQVAAVRDASLSLPAGGAMALVGPSGCGKTTLLRLVAGLEEPDAGEVLIGGEVVSRPGWVLPPCRRGIGMVFQQPALWPHMTVAANVGFGLQDLPRAEAQVRLQEALAGTRTEHLARRYPAQLSGGEARRVALARALAPRPGYLLLDEPLTNLDAELRSEMLELTIAAVSGTGAGMIYVTHDRDEAARVATVLVTMRSGRTEGAPAGTV